MLAFQKVCGWGVSMKCLIGGATLAALLAAAPATASELSGSVAPVYNQFGFYNWNGFYLGLNGGGHWSSDSDPAGITANTFLTGNNLAIMNAALPAAFNTYGFAGGGQAGYNWLISTFVVGVEADVMGLTGKATRSLTVPWTIPAQHATLNESVNDRWLATLRGRVGIAFDRVLFFVTAGGAASNWSISHSYSDNFGAGTPLTTDQVSQTRYGWAAGGGIEFAMGNSWTVRAEYLYANLGGIDSVLVFQNTPGKGATIAHAEGLSESVARAAISYKFGR
jgi:outer membrane immunogenic protein